MSTDGDLRALLRRGLPGPDWEWTPVETGGTASGVPDAHWQHVSGAHGWVECKRTDGWAVDLRPHQVGWIARAAARGVPAAVLVRAGGVGSGGAARDALWAVQGRQVALLSEGGLRAPGLEPLGRWEGPPRTWPWAEIGRLLLSS